MKKHNSAKDYIAVRNWLLSFIPLGVASVLFVFCFLFEQMIWLYALCTVVFGLFVFLYTRANRSITHTDGYTYIQAIAFYRSYIQFTNEIAPSEHTHPESLLLHAKKYDYASNLSAKQVVLLYEIGKNLFERFTKRK